MQAVHFAEHGDAGVIEYGEVPDPEVGRDEVRIDVKAGALTHLDVWTRRGLPGIDLEMPHVPGSDAAGVVREVLPMSEAGRAHRLLEDREGFGKVVVVPDSER